MANIPLGTNYILPDELCFGLFELDFQSPGNRGFHRYRIYQVIRDDKVAEYREDMGPTIQFRDKACIRVPCTVIDPMTGKGYPQETVAHAREAADLMREDRVDLNYIKERQREPRILV